MNNNWHKKEKPLLGLTGLGGGVDGLAVVGAAAKSYVDDVFSTYLYAGNASTRSISNGVDLSKKGGLTWIKTRSGATWFHVLQDSERGAGKIIRTNGDNEEYTDSTALTSFNSDGFSLGAAHVVNSTDNSETYASWTFAKQEKFFDIVTWTGNSSGSSNADRTISHSLGSVPGMIVVKCTSHAQDWNVYHRSVGATKYLRLNETSGAVTNSNRWNDTEPTATEFSVSTAPEVNGSGKTYVAYLFAHNDSDGPFGEDSDKDAISCGTYTGNGSSVTPPSINLGWEPQWILIKRSSGTEEWLLFDTMRGIPTNLDDPDLRPATTGNDNTDRNWLDINSKGFKPKQTSNHINGSGETYIYVAIRMADGVVGKPAEAGTEVFAMDTGASSSTIPNFDSNFPVDFTFSKVFAGSGGWYTNARLIQGKELYTDTSAGEITESSAVFDSNVGWSSYAFNSAVQSWMFKRGKGFDVLTPTTTGSGYQFIYHTCMGQTPEMMWMKKRDSSDNWQVYHKDLNGGTTSYNWYLNLNTTAKEAESGGNMWGLSNPPDETTVVILDSYFGGAGDYLLLLFASVDKISKVGSYTGNGNTGQTITTGFQPRFLIIKSITSSTLRSWYVFDTTRGWASGDDKWLELNDDAGQFDYNVGQPTSTGFTLNDGTISYNGDGEKYIYYAHA